MRPFICKQEGIRQKRRRRSIGPIRSISLVPEGKLLKRQSARRNKIEMFSKNARFFLAFALSAVISPPFRKNLMKTLERLILRRLLLRKKRPKKVKTWQRGLSLRMKWMKYIMKNMISIHSSHPLLFSLIFWRN